MKTEEDAKAFIQAYVNNSCPQHIPREYYCGKCLVPSDAALEELIKYGWGLDDCKEILEEGYFAPRKRKKGIIERWLNKGSKILNVVVVSDYNEFLKEEVYLIIHVVMFTKRKV